MRSDKQHHSGSRDRMSAVRLIETAGHSRESVSSSKLILLNDLSILLIPSSPLPYLLLLFLVEVTV